MTDSVVDLDSLPVPLRNLELLERIYQINEEFKASRHKGHFIVQWNYNPQGLLASIQVRGPDHEILTSASTP